MDKLKEALKAGFISHAYIFLGDGEKISREAMDLSRTVNCKNRDLAPCGYCDSCRKIKNGVHPDIFEIFPEGASVKIDQVRKIIESYADKPLEAAKKVYIIHEAHTMTPQAQNALLKTLEEPVTQSIIIVLADNLKQLLPTVVSRCQVIDFSVGFKQLDIPEEVRQKAAEVFLAAAEKKRNPAQLATEILALGQKTEDLLEFAATLYRDMLRAKTKVGAKLINQEYDKRIEQASKFISEKFTVSAMDCVVRYLQAAKAKGNQSLIWYNFFMELQEVI